MKAAAWYPSPVSFDEQRVGKVAIRHKHYLKGASIMVVSWREAIHTGQRAAKIVLERPLTVHQLCSDEHGVWMSDEPCELNQMARAIDELKPSGSVLVGGLGLGIVARWIWDTRAAHEVVVVERDPDVIRLVAPTLPEGITVVRDDISRYLARKQSPLHDCYMLDTWQGTNEMTWWSTVLPLRRLVGRAHQGRPAPRVHCWAEDVMLAQVCSGMQSYREHGIKKHWYYKSLDIPAACEAEHFINAVGEQEWERKFGVQIDASVKKQRRVAA